MRLARQYRPRSRFADGGMPDDDGSMPSAPIPAPAQTIIGGAAGRPQPPVRPRSQFSVAPPQIGIGSGIPIPTGQKTEPGTVSTKVLADAFDRAIKHHLSLSPSERAANSQKAANSVAEYVGRDQNGRPISLLGKNAKLMKTEKGYKGEQPVQYHDGRGIEAAGLALAPAYQEGKFTTCPNSAPCKDECLGKTSGNYFKLGGGQDLSEFKGPRLNSLKKTIAFMRDPESFAVKLFDEITDAKQQAAGNGNLLGVRLNVLSDINPRVHKAIIEGHPDVAFYDYTKNNTDPIAPNHHYTYSSSGISHNKEDNGDDVHNPHSNWNAMRRRLDGGYNVAMAFTDKEHLPETVIDKETGKKYRVINGDTHDFRPLDIQPLGQAGVIVGLKNKKATGEVQNAHKDSNGFFVKYDPGRMKTPTGTWQREPSDEISPTTGKPKLGPTIASNRTVVIGKQK